AARAQDLQHVHQIAVRHRAVRPQKDETVLGLIIPFIGIKAIDLVVTALHLA
ncbi:MAG: hypothetical protein K0Q64_849, partial [Nitrobacter vulgaris]|nr:hypothetical protein [Nitrobacter vulgaris]